MFSCALSVYCLATSIRLIGGVLVRMGGGRVGRKHRFMVPGIFAFAVLLGVLLSFSYKDEYGNYSAPLRYNCDRKWQNNWLTSLSVGT